MASRAIGLTKVFMKIATTVEHHETVRPRERSENCQISQG